MIKKRPTIPFAFQPPDLLIHVKEDGTTSVERVEPTVILLPTQFGDNILAVHHIDNLKFTNFYLQKKKKKWIACISPLANITTDDFGPLEKLIGMEFNSLKHAVAIFQQFKFEG